MNSSNGEGILNTLTSDNSKLSLCLATISDMIFFTDAPNVAILISDGIATINNDLTLPEADMAKLYGIHIIPVGVTEVIDLSVLNHIASDPNEVILLSSYSDLLFILEPVMAIACLGKGQ